jgi:hypothetical protein
MSQHRPESQESSSRDLNAPLRQVTLKECLDEVPAPDMAVGIVGCQVGKGESTAQPVLLDVFLSNFCNVEPADRDGFNLYHENSLLYIEFSW